MEKANKFHPQYVTDAQGHQTAVILPIEEFNQLLEDLEDLAVVAERSGEPTISHEAVVEQLKADGQISD